ncbi:unnamed protein product [Tuber aestivum]|uniref:Uncharacterized protein n=1 Tax=Tuber aestivum TaxID=59557 RepID=A0A292PM10_9PEZI|nr:unnamed protein product [Tuber aestivum]
MLSSFLVIQDSEDESSDNNAHYQEEDGMVPPPLAAFTGSNSHLRSPSLSSGPGQVSGEAREKAIKEAQSLLLAPPFETPDTPGAQPELVKVATAARRKTANGWLESSISREMDVYDFLVDDDDGSDFFSPPEGKRRKRPAKRSKSVAEESEGLAYENQKAEPGKRRESGAAARRSKSIPDMLQDECSEDDWTPNSKIEKPAGKKSTRSNTNEKELAPLLPKPKRKLKSGALVSSNQFDGDLNLGINTARVVGQSEESSTVQARGDEPNFDSFMVDLTSEDLILATQRKAEYEALSLGLTGSSDATFLPVNFAGREPDAEDYPVLSTIPDPPSDGLGQSQLWGLDHNQSIAVLPPQPPSQPPPQPPLLPEQLPDRMVSSLLSSPPMGKSSAGPPSSAAQIIISREVQSDNTSKAVRSSRSAKRSATDGSIGTEGFGRIASEWRVAKGRSKTMNAVITLSDDEDHLAQEIPEKKKKVGRQRKSAAVGEGAKRGAKGGAAAPAKQGKGKRKGKAVVNDSEDDGAFSDEASAQHPISNPGGAAADDSAALHSEQTPGRRRPGDQVMIAVAIESPSKPVQKCKSTVGDVERIDPVVDIMESNSDLTHGMPQHDYESAPPSPKPVIPAKRAVSGASTGGRKKKTKQEVEDEDINWDEKPKKAAKKDAVKSRNAKVGGKMSVTRGRVNSKKVLDTEVEATTATEDKAEIEAPSPKPAARGRAAKAKVIRKSPMEAEEVVEQDLEEVEEAPAPLKTPKKSKSAKATTAASVSKAGDKKETPAPTEPGADIKSPGSETGTTPAPPERESATPASDSKKASTTTPGRVPFRVGLSRRSKIPSLLRGFRK